MDEAHKQNDEEQVQQKEHQDYESIIYISKTDKI